MKKLLSVALCLVLIFSALPVFTITASAEYISGNYYFSVSNGEVTLLQCFQECSGNVTLPSTLKGYPVKYISNGAFDYCYNITSLTIGDSVVSIGSQAFEDCTALKSISIGKNVSFIGTNILKGCDALESFTLSAQNPYFTVSNYGLFTKDKTKLLEFAAPSTVTEYTIPNSVTTVGKRAFYYNDNLTKITIPSSVKTIEDEAFNYCKNLESITIPDSVTTLGDAVFYNCLNAKTLYIGKGLTTVPAQTFANCSDLTNITIPNNITTIEQRAFYSCGAKSITIPTSVTSIGNDALAYCYYLESIVIPDSVTELVSNTINNCNSLKTITIPKSVTAIDSSNFSNCPSLKEFIVDAKNPAFTAAGGVLYSKDKTILLSYPNAICPTTLTIASGVTTIGYNAFAHHDKIENVILPEGVTTIDAGAFNNSSLKSITIPVSVTTIGDSAFSDSDLESVFYKGAKKDYNLTIGSDFYSDFYGAEWYYIACNGVAAHTYTDKNDTVCNKCSFRRDISKMCGENAFWFFDEATGELSISGWGEMYNYSSTPAWYSKHKDEITSIVVDRGITHIGDYAFKGLTSLTSVTISETVDTIGTQSFYDCTALITFKDSNDGIYTDDGLKSIGTSAFQNTGFKTFVLPETVTTVGSRAFKHCVNLVSISLDDWALDEKYITIGYEALMDCTALRSVAVMRNLTDIPALCFKNCTALTTIEIPEEIKSVGSNAFANCTALSAMEIYSKNCSIGATAIPTSTVIVGYSGSTAETYAKKTGNTFLAFEKLTGYCGDNVQWKLDVTGRTLELKGSGATYNYTNSGNVNPFVEYRAYIEYIYIGGGITYLGNRLFRGLNKTTNVTVPSSVQTMGYEVFYANSKLESVSLREGVTMIGALTFYNCTSLKRISIPSTVTNIQNRAFKGSGLTQIELPKTVKTMGYEVFMNCADLWEVKFSKGVSMLNPRTFENCTSLYIFTVSKNICRIRSRAFYGSAIGDIYFEDADNMWGSSNGQEAKIASNAFEGCKNSLTMHAKEGTHVEAYANRLGFKFSKYN